ncbi:MAG TPA: hypothetical protein VEA41_05815 [Salinarimonas sp.]|nr:hypothetical protein [Salinarimonas sp.]
MHPNDVTTLVLLDPQGNPHQFTVKAMVADVFVKRKLEGGWTQPDAPQADESDPDGVPIT